MRRRRQVVAFEEVVSRNARLLHDAAAAFPVPDEERRRPSGLGKFWCAADRPRSTGDDFDIRPVYRTTRVPGDVCCEDCGIGIRELQHMFTDASSKERR